MSETVALCVFLAALPLGQFTAMDVTILRLTGGLALAVWLIRHLRPHEPIRWDTGMSLMALFVIWGVLSTLWSIEPARSMEKLPTYVMLLVSYFLITDVIRTRKQFSAAMIALWIGVLVLLTSGAVDMSSIWLRGRSFRVSGILGNPNGYVAMIVACIPAGYWVFARTRVPLRRVANVAAFAVAVITSVYSQSRGGVVSIGVFFMGLLAFRQTRWRGVVLTVLFLVVVLRLAPLGFWERWEELGDLGGNIRTETLWPAGWAAFRQNPLIGHGIGANKLALAEFTPRGGGRMSVHSAPLAVAIELGFVGLVLYLGFVTYAAARLLRALREKMKQGNSGDATFAAILLSSFLGFMVTWVKGGGMEYSKMVWVLAGLMAAYARILEQSTKVDLERTMDSRPSGYRREGTQVQTECRGPV